MTSLLLASCLAIGFCQSVAAGDIKPEWEMKGTVCTDPPYPNRNSCHGMQGVGDRYYFNKRACQADIPSVLKKKYPGYRVIQADCERISD